MFHAVLLTFNGLTNENEHMHHPTCRGHLRPLLTLNRPLACERRVHHNDDGGE